MAEDPIVSRRASLLEAEVDGELVGLHVDRGTCYGFNGTATRIWALIEQPKRVSELQTVLLDEYDVDPETCRAQLMELLGELEQDGLVSVEAAPDA
ncbi:PqqD family protein [Sphingomonas parva]|uniref:PqqD family protein n=1 Tax=Sphingomonas parva TaxID=2555898 RepID=UPI00142FD983|nr:PqqD family protein [Sphingomonas parva]